MQQAGGDDVVLEAFVEVVLVELEGQRNQTDQVLPEDRHAVAVGLKRGTELWHGRGPKVRTVVDQTPLDLGVFRREVPSDLEAFLIVGPGAGVKCLNGGRLVAAVRGGVVDVCLELVGHGEGEEGVGDLQQRVELCLVDAVIGDVEEADVARGLVDLPRHRLPLREVGREAVGEVDHRNGVGGLGWGVGDHESSSRGWVGRRRSGVGVVVRRGIRTR